MATDSVLGLFQTPDQYQLAQQAAQMEQARQYAAQDPMQRAVASQYFAGGQLGRALGGEDPQLKMVSARQQILKNVNPQDMKSIEDAAIQFSRMGDGAGVQAMQELAFKQSQITKNLREGRAAATKLQEVGVAEGTREPVYTYQTPQGVAQVVFKNINGEQQMVPYTGGVDRTTAKTNIGVKLPEGESEFVKRLGVKDADRVDAAITTRETATSAINSLNKLASLPSDQLISGQFAAGRVGATNLLTTLGLASPTDANRLATSQQYQKVAGDVILQTLGGKLGSGFSNADREFIASLVPQLETNPEARRKLITFMQEKNQDIVKETVRLENYARANRGLSGFEPKLPLSVTPSKTNPYANLSDAELAAKIAAAQQQRK